MKEFTVSVPRKMFWSTEVGGISACPECGARLEPEHHTYVMMIRERGEITPFIVGNEAGHFCADCPTVVLDHEEFAEIASVATDAPRAAFVVLGLVDLDAIPDDKAQAPLGEDDNPVPLVEFSNLSRSRPRAKSGSNRRRKRNNKKPRKKRR